MSATLSYVDAVDLLDADHKLVVQKMFLDYQALCDDSAPSEARRRLALKICQDLDVHTSMDPNGKDKLQRRGQIAFDFGMFWFKGQKLGTGQCPVKAYNRFLSRLIEQDKVKPSWIVSHELPLEKAPEAYKNFDERKDGWTKVTLKPNG